MTTDYFRASTATDDVTRSALLFNIYEYRTGVFLAKAYVAGQNAHGGLTVVHHSAKLSGLAFYNINVTQSLRRAFHLLEALLPKTIANALRQKGRRPTTLPGLLSTKSPRRTEAIRHVHHRLSELLTLCKTNDWSVSLNLDVRQPPAGALLRFTAERPLPVISFDLTARACTYRLRISGSDRNIPRRIRYGDWKVLTNHPTPGWLVCDRTLLQLGHLNGKHVRPFLSSDEVVVPTEKFRPFWTDFIVKIAKHHVIEATGFTYREVTSPTACRLVAKLHPFEGRYLLHPEWVYGEKVLTRQDREGHCVTYNLEPPYRLTRITRNPQRERTDLEALSDLGLLTDSVTAALYPDERGTYSALYWLIENEARLRQLDIDPVRPEIDGRLLVTPPCSVTMAAGRSGDWLDLTGEIEVGPHRIPFQRFVRYLQKGEHHFPLPDGTTFLIPQEWFTRYRPGLRLARVEGKRVKMARSQTSLLRQLDITLPADEAKSLADAYHPSGNLKATLRPYQLDGVRWLVRHYHQRLGACLADDMGLGKTLQTIAVLQYAKEQIQAELNNNFASDAGAGPSGAAAPDSASKEQSLPAPAATQMDLFAAPAEDESFLQPLRALVVLPASLVFNWQQELQRFAPDLTLTAQTGAKRARDVRILRRFDVILTTYQTALRDRELLGKMEFSYIVLDESQQIKNRQSKIFKTINTLSATHRISLSGTPIENSLSDLWSQMQFINPGLLRGYAFFKNTFIDPIEQEDDPEKKQQLRRLVNPHLLRRTKAAVAPDLPKLETQLYYCEMTAAQRKVYLKETSAARNALLGNFVQEDGEYRFRVIQTLNRLRQLATHPALLDAGYDHGSGKLTEILEQWNTIRRSGHKVLLFSTSVRFLELLKQQAAIPAAEFAWITGSVPSDKRALEVERFQSNPTVQTFFVSIQAGGTGLNLTAADYVFILDPWWNPTIEDQAIARAHRIGRQGNVLARKFITRGTIEEKINRLQNRKRDLASGILNTEEKFSFSKDELGYLLT